MKKIKLLMSLCVISALSSSVAITTTSCSSDNTEIIVSRDVDFIGVSPEVMQESTQYEQKF